MRCASQARSVTSPFAFQFPPGIQARRFTPGDFSGTEDSRELLATYGEPTCFTFEGAKIAIFEIDTHGDGLAVGRFSSSDDNGGETVIAQAHRLLAMAKTRGLSIRYLVVTENNSGRLEFEHRVDFMIGVSAIRAGWCRWIGYAKGDRVARIVLEMEILVDYLRKTRTRLHIADVNGGTALDLDDSNDTVLRQVLASLAEKERGDIQRRTHGALQVQWLQEGKGWPGVVPPGFARATKSRLRHANADFPTVKELFRRYDVLGTEIAAERTGIRELVDSMNEDGYRLRGKAISVTQAYKVLKNSIYVTGEWMQPYEGAFYPCHTEPLPDPVDPALFNRVQLRLSGRNGNVNQENEGLHFLNAIKLTHADCAGEIGRRGQKTRLSAHVGRSGEADTYVHRPSIPACCAGHEGYDTDALERAVVSALRLAASARGVRREWNELAFERWCGTVPLPTTGRPDPHRDPGAYWEWQKAIADQALARIANGEATDDLDAEMAYDLDCRERARQVGDIYPRIPFYRSEFWFASDEDALAEAFLQIVTEEPPADRGSRLLRQAVIEAALDEVIIHDTDDGPAIQVVGTFIPKELARGYVSPQQLAARELDAFLTGSVLAATVPQRYRCGTVAAFTNGMLGDLVPAFASPVMATG